MKTFITSILILFSTLLSSQEVLKEEISINPLVSGELAIPQTDKELPLVIIIAGSGPTDRDGNQAAMKNNSLKFLAEGLNNNNIATFRFDKRIFKLVKNPDFKEEDARFDDFVKDIIDMVNHFNQDKRFSKIIIAGHSKGSLQGMVAINQGARADAFISIAGAGQSIDRVIVQQIGKQQPFLKEDTENGFAELRQKGKIEVYNPFLESIFRKSVQPFMLSWMQYDPQAEIASLTVPVLILNGTEDVQTDESEARLLHQAKPDALFFLIENMNHVLKEVIPGDTMDNGRAYNEPQRPVVPELIEKIVYFIGELD